MTSANRTADWGTVPMSASCGRANRLVRFVHRRFSEARPHRRHEHVAKLATTAVGDLGERHGKKVVSGHATGDVHPRAAGAAQAERVPAGGRFEGEIARAQQAHRPGRSPRRRVHDATSKE